MKAEPSSETIIPSTKRTVDQALIFAIAYILLIPAFAGMYTLEGVVLCDDSRLITSFWEFLYFSVVTITTLGYGDITQESDLAMFLTALEPLLGIVLIGLFLNALSIKHSEKVGAAERKLITKDFNKTVGEIRKASQEMVSQITGGDSYPVMKFSNPSGHEGSWSFSIKVEGNYPLHDLKYRIKDVYGIYEKPEKELGTVMPGNKGVDTLVTDFNTDCVNLIVMFSARNGIFQQNIQRKRLSNGKWASWDWVQANWHDKDSTSEQFEIIKDDDFPVGVRW